MTRVDHPGCSRCQELPEVPTAGGVLYLWFPIAHILTKMEQIWKQRQWPLQVLPGMAGVRLNLTDQQRLDNCLVALQGCLTTKELEDTQALHLPNGGEPQLADCPRVMPLYRLVALSQANWLLDLLAENRLISHFQPIVNAARPNQIFAQEALCRGLDTDASLISPRRLLQTARAIDLLFRVDLEARKAAIQAAAQYRLTTPIFINFTPTAIYDPEFCLKSTVKLIDHAGIPHHNIVFEVTESEETEDIKHLQNILCFYREAGFRVALDDLGSGYSGLNLLHQLRPDFVKLDMELIRDVDRDEYKAMVTGKILEVAQALEIKTIAEGIETAAELAWVQEHGADYVQGYFLARPCAPPRISLDMD